MADPATGFASEAPSVDSATGLRDGEYVHVYRGQVEAIDSPVRLLTPAPAQSDAVMRAFDRCAEEWERYCDHPGISTVHARGDTPRPWLAADGLTHSTILEERPECRVLMTVITDVAEALLVPHRAASIHGALTPDSILVVREGDRFRGQIGDWGLERACQSGAGEASPSPYIAPELRATPDEVAREADTETPQADTETPQADIYSLGAVTYFGVTGRPPVVPGGETAIDAEDSTPPTDVTDLPAGDVLGRALAVDPDDRYESVYEFKLALLFERLDSSARRPTRSTAHTAPATPETGTDSDPTANPDSDSQDNESGDDEGLRTLLTRRRATLGALGAGAVGIGGLGARQLLTGGNPGTDPDTGNPQIPTAAFTGEFIDGTLSVSHDGGDSIPATELVLGGSGFAEMPRFRWSDADAFDEETPVLEGDSLTIETDEKYDIVLLWESTESNESKRLATFQRQSFLNDITGQADPPEATFTLDAAGDSLYVTHEEGEDVIAGYLFVRGEGFPGSPQRRVRDLPGVDAETVLRVGESFSIDAIDSVAAIRIVWESPTAHIGLDRPEESVSLGSYVGPDRPLDTSLGGVPLSQVDSRNTGYIPAVSSEADAVTEGWRFETGGTVRSPVVADGIIYAFVSSRGVFAVDAQDGVELWRFSHPSLYLGGLAVAEETVYFGGHDALYALDGATGSHHWTFEDSGGITAPPLPTGGLVYVCGWPNAVYALDSATGEQEWVFETAESRLQPATLAVAEETVYASLSTGIYALAAASGTRRWHVEFPTPVTEPTVVDDTVFLGTRTQVVALDAHDGSETWRFHIPVDEENNRRRSGSLIPSPAVADDTVYVGGPDATVYALAAGTGQQRWQFETASPVQAAPMVTGSSVYVGTQSTLYCLDREGTERWRHETRAGGGMLPVPLGTVTVVGGSESLYVLEEGT